MLTTQNLSLKIQQQPLCSNLNFTLSAGEVWGLLGANGSGKTTLLHALAGLHPIQEGQISLMGAPLHTLSAQTIAQSVGILFQDTATPFAQSIWEYCLTGRYPHLAQSKKETEADKQHVLQALQAMELMHLKDRAVTKLSGGEKRRLAMATLLAQTPKIYLLDEPTNHLDRRYQSLVLKHCRQLAKQQANSVLMVLHDIYLARSYCDKVLLLLPQGTTLQGTAAELLTPEYLTSVYEDPHYAY
jgi:iron complex transport system ATP-binding protein